MTAPVRLPRSPWDRFLFERQSPSPMALLRIGWGLLATAWALTLLPDVDPLLTDGALGYERARGAGSWNPLDLVDWHWAPLATCLILVVAAAATTVGYRTRASAAVAVLCMLALQRTNTTVFNSGDLFLRQIGIAVALAPSGLLLSWDAARARRADPDALPPERAPWALRLIQLELAFGYLLSAWAKVRGTSWNDGTALGKAMRIEDLQRFAAPEWLYRQDVLLNSLTWASLAFEGTFLFLVWNRKLRPWLLALGAAFHLGIDLLFDVGFFSYVMWVGYLAFLPPEVADRWIAWLQGWWAQRRGRTEPDADPEPSSSTPAVGLPVEPAE